MDHVHLCLRSCMLLTYLRSLPASSLPRGVFYEDVENQPSASPNVVCVSMFRTHVDTQVTHGASTLRWLPQLAYTLV